MSFVRRLFGKGDDGGSGADPNAEPADAGAGGGSGQGDHAYLEFVGGSASKFYAAVLEGDERDSWRVSFNFGRIGFPRAWAVKVEGAGRDSAERVQQELVAEKLRKGYEARPWPASLLLPNGEQVNEASAGQTQRVRGIYIAAQPGRLPGPGESVHGIALPPGRLFAPSAEGGPRGPGLVMWVSERPVSDVVKRWTAFAEAFPSTGLWPLIVDPELEFGGLADRLMDIPRSTGADPFQLLRRWWHENVAGDGDELDDEAVAPFGRAFPGLAARTPGDRPRSIARQLGNQAGYLGLVAVDRPARVPDAIGWMGPANYDLNPNEQSAILETWEDRFDAYLIGLGADTLTLAVGRPPQDLATATAIAAEHMAFCPDNIWQGAESIETYAALLVEARQWMFWWD